MDFQMRLDWTGSESDGRPDTRVRVPVPYRELVYSSG